MDSKKSKVIQIRLSEAEYNSYKFRTKQLYKSTGIKLNTSKLLRIVLSRADNMQFLYDIGYISYFDFMDLQLFDVSKKKRKK